MLRRHGWTSLARKRILEIGCGDGNILHEYLGFGATPALLHGVDLLCNRVAQARAHNSQMSLTCADGQHLPYPSHSFDLVLQYTALSSLLDIQLRQHVAAEMLRAVRPDGMMIWYDFWLNPTNSQTHGIRRAEIRRLFPECRFEFQRITLAPPLTRRLLPLSWMLCTALESLRILNSHFLVAIRPNADGIAALSVN